MAMLASIGKEWPGWVVPLLGAPFVGSFLGVLIARLPTGRPIVVARSACEACGVTLTPRELIPVLSFLLQRGRCRHCGASIARSHLVVELAAIVIVVWTVIVDGDSPWLWVDCLLGWTLLTLAWIDWRWMQLPDVLTLPLVLAGLLVTLRLHPEAAPDHAAAAAAGYAGLRAVGWCYRLIRGRDGIGMGDAKLLAAGGAWLGLSGLLFTILLGAVLGLGMAMLLAAAGRQMRRDSALPFGSCLALAIWLLWLHGPAIARALQD